MTDMFDAALDIAETLNEMYKIKLEQQRRKRVATQNNPLTIARKSRAMKKHWEEKKKAEEQEKQEEKWREEYVPESCYCHMGNPPCSFCTDSNYCEKCDKNSRDEECPKCGENIE
jgi:hypothetical protein